MQEAKLLKDTDFILVTRSINSRTNSLSTTAARGPLATSQIFLHFKRTYLVFMIPVSYLNFDLDT